jgi:transposase
MDFSKASPSHLLKELNQKPFKKLPGSRQSQFEVIDKNVLKPLPSRPYEFAEFKKVRVHIDYHIEVDKHYYSVPHALVRQEVTVRLTATTLECLYQGERVASHTRNYRKGSHTTLPEHMPVAHQKHLNWTPERFLNWAHEIGPATRDLVQHLLNHKAHPEQSYRTCLGLLALAKRYTNGRLEAACHRALAIGAPTRRSVASILEKGLEHQPLPEKIITPLLSNDNQKQHYHENIRGSDYYQVLAEFAFT